MNYNANCGSDRNQSTIISLDWLNNFREAFQANSSPVDLVSRMATLIGYPTCNSKLKRTLHMIFENVKLFRIPNTGSN